MRPAALIVVLVGLLAFGSAAAQAADQFGISPAGTQTFPQRAYRLTVAQRRGLLPESIKITENGDPVTKLSLASADGSRGGEFGAILVIDESASMHGAAIRSAIGAARELARQRSGAQQLGIVVFNQTPTVLLAPTADQQAIDAALGQVPRLAPQTHIFDAVGTALDLLSKAHITAGSIVVLSDGSDTGSRLAPSAVAARARKSNVAIYTVGLRSRAFDSGELKGLAASGRGRYTPAASISDLRRIFRELGAQLARDYLVTYRSFAEPGSDVTVAARVDGVAGIATSTYTVPGGASFVQIRHSFWTSGIGVALTALLSALLIALALGILLVRSGRGPGVRERIHRFASMPGELSDETDAVLTGRPRGGAERSLERTQWWAAFKQDVEIAGIAIAPMRLVTWTVLATLAMMFLLTIITGIALVGLFAIVIPWGVRTLVRIKRDRQRGLFAEQLPDMLQGSASAVRAGHGLVAAMAMVAEDAPEPSRAEFLRVVADEALGVPLDEALRVVQYRMASREVLQIALVAQIQRDTGGNTAEVLDRITEALRQRGELRRMVRALTAQGRLSRWVVTALPLVLLLVVTVANPHYIHPLYTEPFGIFLLVIAGSMMIIGSAIIGKIVDFKV
jgi:tight adherence protein B